MGVHLHNDLMRAAQTADLWSYPVMAAVERVLKGWSRQRIEAWASSTSAFLGGLRPLDVLHSAPDKVLASAHDAIENERNPP